LDNTGIYSLKYSAISIVAKQHRKTFSLTQRTLLFNQHARVIDMAKEAESNVHGEFRTSDGMFTVIVDKKITGNKLPNLLTG
tara:strand:- start:207 stop:452 length:246 start_codon:yes stop_codon:yes gene_type:complete